MSKKEPWHESDDPGRLTRGFLGLSIGVYLVIFLVVAALSIGVWAFRVATSDVKGRGDATITKNSGGNRIAAQERFEDLYQQVVSADRRLDQAAADKAAKPNDPTVATNYTGLVNYCLSVVGDYNANARKYTQADFKAIDLPSVIDDADPATDCKESSK